MRDLKVSVKKLLFLGNPRGYYLYNFILLLRKFIAELFRKDTFTKTSTDSRDIYESYDDREQRSYLNDKEFCLRRGRIEYLSTREIRDEYLSYLIRELDLLVENSDHPIQVLEVGAGNCINLMLLNKRYGSRIKLWGADISLNRLKYSETFWREDLQNVTLFEANICQRQKYEDGYFDLVFSMHCLEQISYSSHEAIKEMMRLARKKVVLIEPVFELGNAVQKLYLYLSDHNRILKKTIRDLGVEPKTMKPLDIQGYPLNQSSLCVIDL